MENEKSPEQLWYESLEVLHNPFAVLCDGCGKAWLGNTPRVKWMELHYRHRRVSNNENKIEISAGKELFRFRNQQDWVNNASTRFPGNGVSAQETLCVDARGRICLTGNEFMRAEREKTYPIRVYRAVI